MTSTNRDRPQPPPTKNEKRQAERATVQVWAQNNSGEEFSIWLSPNDFGDDFTFCYSTRDLSATGIFLESPNPLPIGSEVDLQFTLPTSPAPIRVAGRVVRQVLPPESGAPRVVPGMGVKFDNLTEEQKNIIVAFISRYTTP